MNFKVALLFLVIAIITLSGCEKREVTPSDKSLSISMEMPFEDWDEVNHDNATQYTSPDGQFLISVVKSSDEDVQGAIDLLKDLNTAGFSINNIQDTTISDRAGKEIDMTYSGEPPMKSQINLIEVSGDLFKISIVLPPGEEGFLSDPDKWPAFLNKISFEVD